LTSVTYRWERGDAVACAFVDIVTCLTTRDNACDSHVVCDTPKTHGALEKIKKKLLWLREGEKITFWKEENEKKVHHREISKIRGEGEGDRRLTSM
jgi:hypothetical protein